MAEITISTKERKRFEKFVLDEASRIVGIALEKMDAVMRKEAERLSEKVISSRSFQKLKTPAFIGRFGFTPQEVARLDQLKPLIVGGDPTVTNIEKNLKGGTKKIQLNWVDFERLKNHQIAEHPLTKLNIQAGGFGFEPTGTIVSWIEWWEEGVTIRGHVFTRGNQFSAPFSRSGFGLMQTRTGSLFAMRPTRIFELTGEQQKNASQRRLLAAFENLLEQ